MCMEDVRIGRETQSREVTTTVAVAPNRTQLLTGRAERVAIIFVPNAGADYEVTTTSRTGSGGGLLVTTLMPPITLTIQEHGDLVRQAWFCIAAAAIDVTVFEVWLAKQ